MVAIRSPFCRSTPSYCAQLSGEDLSRYSNKIKSAGLRKCPYKRYLTKKVMSASKKHFAELDLQHGGKNSWHRYNMKKLRHCHPMYSDIFGRPFVKRFTLCYQTVACHVCPSVWNIGVLWPNSWMEQDDTCNGGRPWPWPHCVRQGPSSPSPKGQMGTSLPPSKRGQSPPQKKKIGPCLLWPNRWMDEAGTQHVLPFWQPSLLHVRFENYFCRQSEKINFFISSPSIITATTS